MTRAWIVPLMALMLTSACKKGAQDAPEPPPEDAMAQSNDQDDEKPTPRKPSDTVQLEDNAPEFPDLKGTKWKVLSIGRVTPTSQDMAFSDDGVSGDAGCNRYNATVTINGRELSFGPVASTRKLCPTGMEAEQAFLAALEATVAVQYTSGLMLQDADGNTVVTLAKQVE